jgi:hypothetical protein
LILSSASLATCGLADLVDVHVLRAFDSGLGRTLAEPLADGHLQTDLHRGHVGLNARHALSFALGDDRLAVNAQVFANLEYFLRLASQTQSPWYACGDWGSSVNDPGMGCPQTDRFDVSALFARGGHGPDTARHLDSDRLDPNTHESHTINVTHGHSRN